MDAVFNGPKIYIVGSNQLQYGLLAFCLENELNALCICQSEVSSIDPGDEHVGTKKVWLFDCHDVDIDELEACVYSFVNSLPDDIPVALFNVKPQFNLARMVKHNKIRGLFYKDDSRQVFIKGVRTILEGRLWLTRKMLSECILMPQEQSNSSRPEIKVLSGRERMILQHVASGASNQEIADSLGISIHTVKTHLYKIYRKINVPNRLQATLWANACMKEFSEPLNPESSDELDVKESAN
jgi:LuxR family transcriptional regulator, positive regulator of biofilm formation